MFHILEMYLMTAPVSCGDGSLISMNVDGLRS